MLSAEMVDDGRENWRGCRWTWTGAGSCRASTSSRGMEGGERDLWWASTSTRGTSGHMPRRHCLQTTSLPQIACLQLMPHRCARVHPRRFESLDSLRKLCQHSIRCECFIQLSDSSLYSDLAVYCQAERESAKREREGDEANQQVLDELALDRCVGKCRKLSKRSSCQ